jgi:hypothetical protein
MASRIPEDALAAIEKAVTLHPERASFGDIAEALTPALKDRTLQYRLRYLVDKERLITQGGVGAGRGIACRNHRPQRRLLPRRRKGRRRFLFRRPASKCVVILSQSMAARKPVGYDRQFLDSYRPNVTFYLSEAQRAHLAKVGTPNFADQAAGTYAKQILNRLLIDLSWNSSRLEGNTYSLLDTKRLIEFSEEAAGRDRLEAQMSCRKRNVS